MNTKNDVCNACGYTGEIQIVENEDGKYEWECPQCRNRDMKKMYVVRRTCGYLGSNYWNQGSPGKIKERVIHL